ncbi:hypothetical protein GN956_G19952 [Arapaima gigas]
MRQKQSQQPRRPDVDMPHSAALESASGSGEAKGSEPGVLSHCCMKLLFLVLPAQDRRGFGASAQQSVGAVPGVGGQQGPFPPKETTNTGENRRQSVTLDYWVFKEEGGRRRAGLVTSRSSQGLNLISRRGVSEQLCLGVRQHEGAGTRARHARHDYRRSLPLL